MKRRLDREQIQKLRLQLDEDVRAGRLQLHEAAKVMRQIVRMTQPEFARFLGVAERTYADFERGVGNPTLETLKQIGSLFGFAVKFGPLDTLHDEGKQLRLEYQRLAANRKAKRK